MDFRLYNTRVRIVAGMLACMKEKPFRKLKDKDIIAKAQVSSRTFYHYYKDRNNLLDFLEKQLLTVLQEAMTRDFEAGKALHGAKTFTSWRTRLLCMCWHFASKIRRRPRCCCRTTTISALRAR